MAKQASKKISTSTGKIAEIGNQLLALEGLNEWEVDEIRLTKKNGFSQENLVCRWEKNDLGEWVLKCYKP